MIRLLALLLAICFSPLFPMWTELRADQHVVVVLDDSGSMKDQMRMRTGRARRIDVAKQALQRVLASLSQDTQIGVLTLNSQVQGSHWIVPLGSADASRWSPKLAAIQAQGGTLLGEYIRQGADELLKQRAVHRYGTYRLLVVTDGEANDSQVLDKILPDVVSRGLLLDVIGVDMASDHSLADRAHSYRRADDAASLEQAIADVFAETSNQGSDITADFEMLAALPDEFAVEGLQALARAANNDPIEKQVSEDSDAAQPGSVQPGGTVGSTPVTLVLGMVCCLGVFIGLAFFIIVLANLSSARGRRRR